MAAFRCQQEDGGQQANSLDPPSNRHQSNVNFSLWAPLSPASSASPSVHSQGEKLTEKLGRKVAIKIPIMRYPISDMDSVLSLRRETRHFVSITAMHGVRRVWESKGRSKVFWSIAVIVMAALMFSQVATLITNFIEKPTVSQVSFVVAEEGLNFPKITICSYNPIRKSYIEKINTTGDFTARLVSYLMLANNDIYKTLASNEQELVEAEEEFDRYQETHADFNINDFYNEAGLSCESVLKNCTFAGKSFNCCNYSTSVTTSLGLCHALLLKEYLQPMMKQTEGTENAGLQIILDAHNDEKLVYPLSSSILSSPLENGFRFYVDEPETSTYSSSQGVSVSPGDVVYSAISLTKASGD